MSYLFMVGIAAGVASYYGGPLPATECWTRAAKMTVTMMPVEFVCLTREELNSLGTSPSSTRSTPFRGGRTSRSSRPSS